MKSQKKLSYLWEPQGALQARLIFTSTINLLINQKVCILSIFNIIEKYAQLEVSTRFIYMQFQEAQAR
jgi:hypothetical protein